MEDNIRCGLLSWCTLHETKNVKVLIASTEETDSNHDHKPALEHKCKAPANEFLKKRYSDSSNYIACHNPNNYEWMKDSHPFSIAFPWRKFIDPYWSIDNAKSLCKTQHKSHEIEKPHIWRETEYEACYRICDHIYSQNPICTILLEYYRYE